MQNSRVGRVLILIVSLYLSFGCSDTTRFAEKPTLPLADSLRGADLLFRRGVTLQSEAIARSSEQYAYSHVGIVVGFHPGDSIVWVVDIEPERGDRGVIKIESIEEFFSPTRSAAGAIFRYEGLSPKDRATIETCAQELLRRGVGFDHDYMLSDSSKMYCTELIEHLFAKVGIDISQGIRHRLPLANESVILPSDIASNPRLRAIWSYD